MVNMLAIHSVRELIFVPFSIVTIIFCFKTRSQIDNIKDLKIRTNFSSNTNKNNLIAYLENNFENDEKNKYEEFFSKYNLKEGQTFSDNEDITNSLNHLYKLNLAIIIILIILLLPTILGYICIIIDHFNQNDDINVEDINFYFLLFFIFVRLICSFILFCVYLGLFLSYKYNYEKDISDFYDGIDNKNEQTLFKDYYKAFFDLRTGLIIVSISLPINIIACIGFILHYCKFF